MRYRSQSFGIGIEVATIRHFRRGLGGRFLSERHRDVAYGAAHGVGPVRRGHHALQRKSVRGANHAAGGIELQTAVPAVKSPRAVTVRKIGIPFQRKVGDLAG